MGNSRARNQGLFDHGIETTLMQGRLGTCLITQSRRIGAGLLMVKHLNPLTKKVVESRAAADLLATEDRTPNPRTQKPTGPSAMLRRRARLLTSSS